MKAGPLPLWWGRTGRVLAGIAIAVLALHAPRVGAATTYLRGSLGNIDVLTGDSPENTKQLLCEIVEVRRQLQSLVGDIRLPEPRMQVVIFKTMREYRDFAPSTLGIGLATDFEAAGSFTADENGLTLTVVRSGDYEPMRQIVLTGYARYLLQYTVPDAPLWIRVGLPEYFSTIRCRQNRIILGKPARNHADNLRGVKLLPLARLMSDAEMNAQVDNLRHDTALYHESWALWHQWLTDGRPDRREQVGRLLAAVRRGAPGDAGTLGECFRQPLAEIEGAHRNRKFFGSFPEIEANADAASLVAGLRFAPADELDRKVAMATVFGRTRKSLGTLGYDLLQLALAHPESPRPLEGLAVLALGTNDTEGSARYWVQAHEVGTNNSYAYLLAVRTKMQGRPFDLSLRGNLPEAMAEQARTELRRCLELNPGEVDAQYYRAWVEAFAHSPQRAMVEEVARSNACYLRPGIFLTMAIARWRLGDRVAARELLAEYQTLRSVRDSAKPLARQLEEAMQNAEKAEQ